MIDKRRLSEEFIWNPSNSECKCDKSSGIGEYIDYKSCRCWKRVIDKLAEKCSENTNGNELIYNETVNDSRKVCNSCRMYIVLLLIFFVTCISISSASIVIVF